MCEIYIFLYDAFVINNNAYVVEITNGYNLSCGSSLFHVERGGMEQAWKLVSPWGTVLRRHFQTYLKSLKRGSDIGMRLFQSKSFLKLYLEVISII